MQLTFNALKNWKAESICPERI